jgi:hypothetical protein
VEKFRIELNKKLAEKMNSMSSLLDRDELNEWAKDKPLSILRLDPVDRAILKIAGKFQDKQELYHLELSSPSQ